MMNLITILVSIGIISLLVYVVLSLTSGGVHLSFQCPICKLEYSKNFFFILNSASFTCPFCQRSYVLEIKGTKCLFRGDIRDLLHSPAVFPFEVDWDPLLPAREY